MRNKIIGIIWTLCILFPYLVQAQTCNSNMSLSTPDDRFVVNGDGTVTDKQTGLMWMRCSQGLAWDGVDCNGTATSFNWQTALGAAEDHSFSIYQDWRLPNLKELASIVEVACHEPAININIFPGTTSTSYWSSSPFVNDSTRAWIIFFDFGGDKYSNKDGTRFVRLVRL